jgi:hypothetical protein
MSETARPACEELQARLQEIRAASRVALEGVRSEPFDQDWQGLSNELSASFQEAIEVRYHYDLSCAALDGPPPPTFLVRFEALERWHLDLARLDLPLLIQVRRLLVHEMRNDIAVLHLLVDAAECQPEMRTDTPEIEEALIRIGEAFEKTFR